MADADSAGPDGVHRVRVVSESDGEVLEGVTMLVVGADPSDRVELITDEFGEARLPGFSVRRCRLSLEGFVAKNIRHMGALRGEPAKIQLRPFARLFGRVQATLPPYTPTADRRSTFRRHLNFEVLARIELAVDGRLRFKKGEESNYRGILSATRRMSDEDRDVQSDGTWSLLLEIPPEIDLLHDFVVKLEGNGGTRPLGAVPYIRPGDSIEVEDAWAGAQPLNLRFVSPDGSPLSPELRVLLYRQSPEGFSERIGEFKLESDGRVPDVSLATGTWQYKLPRTMNSPSLPVKGTFEHTGGQEREVELPAGGPLTVVLPRQQSGSGSRLQIGIASAGQSTPDLRSIDARAEVTFPFVSAQEAWQLVVLKRAGAPRGFLDLGKRPDLVEIQRLPISVGQQRIELSVP